MLFTISISLPTGIRKFTASVSPVTIRERYPAETRMRLVEFRTHLSKTKAIITPQTRPKSYFPNLETEYVEGSDTE